MRNIRPTREVLEPLERSAMSPKLGEIQNMVLYSNSLTSFTNNADRFWFDGSINPRYHSFDRVDLLLWEDYVAI